MEMMAARAGATGAGALPATGVIEAFGAGVMYLFNEYIEAPVRVFVQMLNRSALANGGGRPGSASLHFVPIYWPGTPALL